MGGVVRSPAVGASVPGGALHALAAMIAAQSVIGTAWAARDLGKKKAAKGTSRRFTSNIGLPLRTLS
jgi:hypothetical protein